MAASASAASAATALNPDLQVLAPRDIDLGGASTTTPILHFTNTVFNGGAGPLELHDDTSGTPAATQWIFNDDGSHSTQAAGPLAGDNESFAGWVRYDLWKPGSDTSGAADFSVTKNALCAIDEEPVLPLAAASWPGHYTGSGCSATPVHVLGISPGWGDTFDFYRSAQDFPLGSAALPDGIYTLRTTADPNSHIQESDEGNNSATVTFSVVAGVVQDGRAATGTLVVDKTAPNSNGAVTLHVVGRDDVLGVRHVRFSNDGVNFSAPIDYTPNDTQTGASYWTDFAWNVGATPGTHTVYAMFGDAGNNYGAPVSDTVVIPAGPGNTNTNTQNQNTTHNNPIAQISKLLAKPSKFRAAKSRHSRKGGTILSFVLSAKGTLLITIERKVGSSAAAYKKVGTLKIKGKAGANKVRFNGWVGRKKLTPGRYRAVALVSGAPKGTKTKSVSFRVVR